MAAPAWKTPPEDLWTPDPEAAEEEESSVLQRWVELPGGRLELLDLPLTPELFLDPELDDKMVQGQWHGDTCLEISGLLKSYFRSQPDVRVVFDLKHRFGAG